MKKSLILIGVILLGLLIVQTGCEKEQSMVNNPIKPEMPLKYGQGVSDSILCIWIDNFIDSVESHSTSSIEFDSATFYLEASVNFHYGRADNPYGESLNSSFEVTIDMDDTEHTSYYDLASTRDAIIDSLKVIYDDIEDDSKFLIYAMIETKDVGSTESTYLVHCAFGWGDYVTFDEEEPYERTSVNWETAAPQYIRNAALALYANQSLITPIPQARFYTHLDNRYWSWYPGDVWKVMPPSPAEEIDLENDNATVPNYINYYMFWQSSQLTGTHDNLDATELNFYIYHIDASLNNEPYGFGWPFTPGSLFCGLVINANTYGNPWLRRYYSHIHYFGVPIPCAILNFQKSLDDWI